MYTIHEYLTYGVIGKLEEIEARLNVICLVS